MTIGNKLIQIREKLNFTQLEFAEKLNLNAKTLRDNEKNKHSVKFEVIEKLVKKYNINPLFFFFENEEIILNENKIVSSDSVIRNLFNLSKEEAELAIKFIQLLKNNEFKDLIKNLR